MEKDSDITLEERIRRYYKATEAEDYFPASGACGNPVHFAAKWGLPLSKSYLRSLKTLPDPSPRKPASRKKRKK